MDYKIQTERLCLRVPSLDDQEALFELMSEKTLTEYLTWEPHQTPETTRIVIQSLIDAQENDQGYHWCICHNDQIIGLVSLIDVRRKLRTWTLNRAELSYLIGTNYQGRGFATEASKAVVDFGLSELDLHKIIVAHALENVESKKICGKLGFKLYATEHDAFSKNGKWHDLLWYESIKNRK